uniref:Dolichyl-phosphate beta-glucosyltransferase n=1 Tax=Riptortus pedestris TaxID=329032 RepID=R4WPG9_RIPPE|nr:dolichyl-phosphate beta-D-mannosyltransferase, putative [Riptortus pedestris]
MDYDVLPAIYFLIIAFLTIIFTSLITLYCVATQYPTLKRSKKERTFYDVNSSSEQFFPSLKDPFSINLSVIVPAYDEEKRLPPMLDECLEFLENRQNINKSFKYEVIIVSDGSKDQTVKVALEYNKKFGSDKVRILDLKPNRGKGGAVRMGVMSARGAVILFADADGATKFSDFSKLEESLIELIKCDYITDPKGAAELDGVVCGSRSHLEEESLATRSLFRTFLMHGFHFLVWSLAVRSIRDTQCGFKLFTRKSARALFSSIHVERWAFDVELLFLAEKLKIPISEICVNWTEIDGSKIVPVLSWLQMGRDLFLIWLRYKIGAWKVAGDLDKLKLE